MQGCCGFPRRAFSHRLLWHLSAISQFVCKGELSLPPSLSLPLPLPSHPKDLLLCWSNPSLVTSVHCLKAPRHLDHLGENVFLKRGRLRNRDLHLCPQGNYQMANGLFSLDEPEQLNQAYRRGLDFISNQSFCFTS